MTGPQARKSRSLLLVGLSALTAGLCASCGALDGVSGGAGSTATASAYDLLVLNDYPVAYLTRSSANLAGETDQTKRGYDGKYYPVTSPPAAAVMPNGELAAAYNGVNQYLEIPDSNAFSITTQGALTIEAWIRPDVLNFVDTEGSGYVYWGGKGSPSQHEYALRMYSFTNTENPARPNRISGYAFNLAGNLGSGSYFQDSVTTGQWMHVAVVFNSTDTSASMTYPGYVKIYKNGVLRDTTEMSQFSVTPANGTAPFRLGTRNFGSYFQGAIGKVAVYPSELGAERISAHYALMCASGC
jgi:hypothetical protein